MESFDTLRHDRRVAIAREPRRLMLEPMEQRLLLAGDAVGLVAFDEPIEIVVGSSGSQSSSHYLDAVDLDRDGDQDLVVLNTADDNFSVLLNDGNGQFEQRRFVTDDAPFFGAIADLNRDETPDLAIRTKDRANWFVTAHLGRGDGTFASGVAFPTEGETSMQLVAGQFDDDGDMDLATANQYSANVSILLGEGEGSFAAPELEGSGGSGATGITAGDFDSDGDLDLAVAHYFSAVDAIGVLLGNGDGTFGPVEPYNSGDHSWDVKSADLNNDGHLDLVVTTTGGPSIMLGKGDGTFHDGRVYNTYPVAHWSLASREDPVLQPFGLDAGDLNGDGRLDLVLANWSGADPETEWFGVLSVMLGGGDGSLGEPIPLDAGVWPRAVVAADLDGDGDLDLAASDSLSDKLTLLLNRRIMAGDANRDEVFNQWDIVQLLQAGKYGTSDPADWSQGDFNGDGVFDQLDIVKALRTVNYQVGN